MCTDVEKGSLRMLETERKRLNQWTDWQKHASMGTRWETDRVLQSTDIYQSSRRTLRAKEGSKPAWRTPAQSLLVRLPVTPGTCISITKKNALSSSPSLLSWKMKIILGSEPSLQLSSFQWWILLPAMWSFYLWIPQFLHTKKMTVVSEVEENNKKRERLFLKSPVRLELRTPSLSVHQSVIMLFLKQRRNVVPWTEKSRSWSVRRQWEVERAAFGSFLVFILVKTDSDMLFFLLIKLLERGAGLTGPCLAGSQWATTDQETFMGWHKPLFPPTRILSG